MAGAKQRRPAGVSVQRTAASSEMGSVPRHWKGTVCGARSARMNISLSKSQCCKRTNHSWLTKTEKCATLRKVIARYHGRHYSVTLDWELPTQFTGPWYDPVTRTCGAVTKRINKLLAMCAKPEYYASHHCR